MSKIYVVPGKGRRIQLPGGKFVPEEGMAVEQTTFIARRLRDGDLVLRSAGQTAAATEAAAAKASPPPAAPPAPGAPAAASAKES